MSCHFEKKNLLLTDATPVVSFHTVLSPLSPILRTATCGLLAGFSPEIAVQTLDATEANTLWDLKYKDDLYTDLETLQQKLPINITAIVTIARNVFVRRHTLTPARLSYVLYHALVNGPDSVASDVFTDDEKHNVMQSFHTVLSDYVSLSTVPAYDFKTYKQLTEVISEYGVNVGDSIYLTWRELCIQLINYTRWIIKDDENIIYNPAVIKEVLLELFLPDIVPEALLNNGKVNFDPMVAILLAYHWDLQAASCEHLVTKLNGGLSTLSNHLPIRGMA